MNWRDFAGGAMEVVLAVAVGIAFVALLLWAMSRQVPAAEPSPVPRKPDYSRVMVIVHSMSRGCIPCDQLKAEYQEIHERYPGVHWAFAYDGQAARKIRQYGRAEKDYAGRRCMVSSYPTVIIYRQGKSVIDSFSETCRIVGYNDSIRKLIELGIRTAAE